MRGGVSAFRLTVFRALTAVALVSGGCTVGPDFEAPSPGVPDAFPAETAESSGASRAVTAETEWWARLGSPELAGIVDRALSGNLDVKIAGARIREARARSDKARSGWLPTLRARSDARAYSLTERGTGSASRFQSSYDVTQSGEALQGGFDVRWELDLFGGTRRRSQAAEARVAAARDSRRGAAVSVAAEVARVYARAAEAEARLRALETRKKALAEIVEIERSRAEAGEGSLSAAKIARARVSDVESRMVSANGRAEDARARLAVLAGAMPGDFELPGSFALPAPKAPLTAGVPADAVARRPDVRRAESRLEAATAEVGVAIARLYPKISLTGSLDFDVSDIANPMGALGEAWSLGPSLNWPLFSGGAARADVEAAKARLEEAELRFRKTVLAAFEEASRAIRAYRRAQEREGKAREALAAREDRLETARARYEAGQADKREVLRAQAETAAARAGVARAESRSFEALVRVYKALGGGWRAAEKAADKSVSAEG